MLYLIYALEKWKDSNYIYQDIRSRGLSGGFHELELIRARQSQRTQRTPDGLLKEIEVKKGDYVLWTPKELNQVIK